MNAISEDVICVHVLVAKIQTAGIHVGSDEKIAEIADLKGPEDIDERYLGQKSVELLAQELQSVIAKKDDMRVKLDQFGEILNARTLLIGPVGSDFDTFVQYLVREIPANLVQIKMKNFNAELFSQQLIEVLEFSKRNAPCILYLPYLHLFADKNSMSSIVIVEELENVSWEKDEIIVVASTTNPDGVDKNLLASFERIYKLSGATSEDILFILESVLQDRKDLDPTAISEIVNDWNFSDVKRLAKNLLLQTSETSSQMTREQLEKTIEKSRVAPIGSERAFHHFISESTDRNHQILSKIEEQYPDDFLDQLYLMAVGEDYHKTQRVIETLNSNLPLTEENREFLTRHPYILSGSSEDRLTRLLKAKKANDRLRRVLGR
jgi:replication-associated recombination protein RarA